MPLRRVDPFLGVCFAEKIPPRDCAYPACPKKSSGYDGRTLKICAKCKQVRYCSKECQKQHWSEHKQNCRKYQVVVNYYGWMMEYDWLLRWVATEALRAHTTDGILHNIIEIYLTYSDKAPSHLGPLPSPFYIVLSQVTPISSSRGGMEFSNIATPKALQESREIRAGGGLGRAFFVFNFIEDFFSKPMNVNTLCRPWTIDLTNPPNPGYKYSFEWKGLFAGIVNGKISLDDLGRNVEKRPALTDAETEKDSMDDLVDGLNDVSMS
ncbi:hypothetical protein GYMLUDRAFT_263235 [Collybiopsis luxurians FD-317 M1]|uniref:MYND-type domain-containing protein n=1 Tax=Collybiopsis luxurians FD-317 M1 TaxID=944289 RepID=A0A0D0CPD8_9AGAR|nr:hypothetical protein GYMLUDRAFT_263235 [Collybiopsis luxurians FD-317 M1]